MRSFFVIAIKRLVIVWAFPFSDVSVGFEIGVAWDRYSNYSRIAIFLLLFVLDFRLYDEIGIVNKITGKS